MPGPGYGDLIDLAELPGSPVMQFPFNNTPRNERRVSPTPAKAAERFIAIGIDFGTTFSGVSWAYSEDPNNLHEVSHWPCVQAQSKDEVQVPTQYDLASNSFGYMIPREALPIKWFKLLLLEAKDTKEDIKGSGHLVDAQKKLEERGMDVVEVIADYLGKLWDHTLSEIQTELDIELLPLRVAITIPAIWPQYARVKMRQAAKKAGIMAPRPIGETILNLVEEPEAAALATLFERKNYPEIAVGETFIVCDCGGGTVDIISYRVKSIEPFRLEEAAKGDGKLCGAFLIDEAFERWMQYKSGLKFDKCRAPQTDFRMFVNDEWEYTLKRAFSGKERNQDFPVRPPARAFGTVKRWRGNNDSYSLKSGVVEHFYDKTMSGIQELISDQKKEIMRKHGQAPKKILLVGGLGSSRYIYNTLQEVHENVLQPTRAWSVVARGAVMAVLRNTFSSKEFAGTTDMKVKQALHLMPEISARVSRYHYGVESGIPFSRADPPPDQFRDRVTTTPDGIKEVWRMNWYLKKGDTLDNKDPVSYEFFQWVTSASSKSSVFCIMESDASQAPIRKDETVKKLCNIDCKFDVPFEELKVIRGNSRRVDGINLTMRFQGEPEWSLRIGNNKAEHPVNVQYAGSSLE